MEHGTAIAVVPLPDLIDLKRQAGRPKDLEDIVALEGSAMVERDGWARHAEEQQQATLKLTPSQRLRWLWQAKLFAERAKKAAEARRKGSEG